MACQFIGCRAGCGESVDASKAIKVTESVDYPDGTQAGVFEVFFCSSKCFLRHRQEQREVKTGWDVVVQAAQCTKWDATNGFRCVVDGCDCNATWDEGNTSDLKCPHHKATPTP